MMATLMDCFQCKKTTGCKVASSLKVSYSLPDKKGRLANKGPTIADVWPY